LYIRPNKSLLNDALWTMMYNEDSTNEHEEKL